MSGGNNGPALVFRVWMVDAKCGNARASTMVLPHGSVLTPVFMPVGTQGTIKGLTSEQVERLGFEIVLGNTYHLGHRPGSDIFERMGGLHEFMGWNRNILTDSGGFQMVSLLQLVKITEEGVEFRSPHGGSLMTLTPEHSIRIQNLIGADIIMALDDVVSSLTTNYRVEDAMRRTIRWLDRCITAHARPHDQNLFGIVQGGLEERLRRECAEHLVSRDLAGYAIGGLSGGEAKDRFWRMVKLCVDILPEGKPRYLMGVGFGQDMVVCVALGVDMFDCVYPCRTARFGTALTRRGNLKIRKKVYRMDFSPIESDCPCAVCKSYTRAYLHSLSKTDEFLAQLLTFHNLAFQKRLMDDMRTAILNSTFPSFVQDFMTQQFPNGDYPNWIVDSLLSVGITLPKP